MRNGAGWMRNERKAARSCAFFAILRGFWGYCPLRGGQARGRIGGSGNHGAWAGTRSSLLIPLQGRPYSDGEGDTIECGSLVTLSVVLKNVPPLVRHSRAGGDPSTTTLSTCSSAPELFAPGKPGGYLASKVLAIRIKVCLGYIFFIAIRNCS